MKPAIALFFIVILCLPGTSKARVFDVNSLSQLEDAIDKARNGDIIQFAPGDCRCSFNTKHNGVTFKGAEEHSTRLLPNESSGFKHVIGVNHNETKLIGLGVDGEKRDDSGHGMVRIGSANDVEIRDNEIVNAGSSHISAGGSRKKSKIERLTIVGNKLRGAGFRSEHGESIYLGDFQGTGMVDRVLIEGNELSEFSDNAIDMKPPTRNVTIRHNWIHDQVERPGVQGNQGTFVNQSVKCRIENNLIENVIGGSSVFNLAADSGCHVSGNVVTGVKKTEAFLRIRSVKPKLAHHKGQGKTRFANNVTCGSPWDTQRGFSGFDVKDNEFLSMDDCQPHLVRVKAAIAKAKGDALDPGPVDLEVTQVWYTRYGTNDVRVWVQATDEGPLEMSKRTFQPGSVEFSWLDGRPIHFRKQKPASPGDGWVFYLQGDSPVDEAIRMVAQEGWITGAPAIDRTVPNWVPDEPPVSEMAPGDTVLCPNTVRVDDVTSGGVRVRCNEKE